MFNNLRELITSMPDEKACRDYLIKERWNGIPVCPYCGHDKCYVIECGKRFKCGSKACYKKFSVTIGTIFEASNIPLTKWLMAIYICSAHKKGISSYQLGRDLGISQKTAWFILHRIRYAFGSGNDSLLLDKEIQADETFVGGNNKNRHKSKKHFDETGKEYDDKAPVMGMIETGGRVKTRVVNNPTKQNAISFLEDNAVKGITLVTDSSPIYHKIGKKYDHVVINHSLGEYKLNGFHTNGMENYWSVLKRGIYGIYHQVSQKHLQAYCDEFSFRFNSRKMKDAERFTASISKIEGRLTYKTLISKPEFLRGGKDVEETMEE
jgi:transposase-like protein